MSSESQASSTSVFVRRERIISIVGLYLACLIVLGPNVRFSQWSMTPEQNPAVCEGMMWGEGRLDLPDGGVDIATYGGKFYNVFPPMWPIVSFAYFTVQDWIIGPPAVMYPIVTNLLISIPLPILVFSAFRRTGVRPAWAAVLSFQLFAGTCMWTVATGMHQSWIYSLQLVLANSGIAMVASGLLGRQRFWLAGLGVLVSSWCRQTTLAYSLAVVVLAWRSERRGRALLQAGIPIVIALAVPMTLNQLKFDSPIDTGYKYIFDADADSMNLTGVHNADGSISVFSLRFAPRHFYSMWLDMPSLELALDGLHIEGDNGGNAIWFATPLLLLVFFDARRWWADPVRRWLLIATIPIILAHMLYHGPVIGQPGMYRYSLDFVLIWLIVVAPETTKGRRQGFALLSMGWSVLYFYTITRGYL